MKLLTIPEACAALRISRATLYKLVKRGALAITKVGGKSLIPEEAIRMLVGVPREHQEAEAKAWEQYYEDLLHLRLTIQESRQAIVAPKFADLVPIKVKGKPASEIIIEERGAH